MKQLKNERYVNNNLIICRFITNIRQSQIMDLLEKIKT